MTTRRRSTELTADEALARLTAGNERFVRGKARRAPFRHESLGELTKGQKPYATVLGCSDSRVPPEWVFDAGLGELFVIRVAGNVLSPEVAGSLQYASAHLRTPLFVVLGHEGCGAVAAALATLRFGVKHKSHIQILVDNIIPELPDFRPRISATARLSRAVEANVRRTVGRIFDSPEGRAHRAVDRMKIVGAVYQIGSGHVRWLSPD
jgi:carbonic anhydrase